MSHASFLDPGLPARTILPCGLPGLQFVPGVHRFDPELGYITNPNLDFAYHTEEFDIQIRTNSQGYRDDEESMDSPRVVFLGDSFCFGWGVQQEETCATVFENLTGTKTLNLGISGYGTVQECLLFERACEDPRFGSPVVVVLVYANDLEDNCNLLGLWPTLYKHERQVSFTTPSEEAFGEWFLRPDDDRFRMLGEPSYIVDLFRKVYLDVRYTRKVMTWLESHPWDCKKGRLLNQGETFEHCVRKLRAVACERGSSLLFTYIPSRRYSESSEDEDCYAIVRNVLCRLSLPLVDLRTVLSVKDYFLYDIHWNPSGHRKAAWVIHKVLAERGLID